MAQAQADQILGKRVDDSTLAVADQKKVCVRVCVRTCVRACVRVCACVRASVCGVCLNPVYCKFFYAFSNYFQNIQF